jgi:hypothetical protein
MPLLHAYSFKRPIVPHRYKFLQFFTFESSRDQRSVPLAASTFSDPLEASRRCIGLSK